MILINHYLTISGRVQNEIIVGYSYVQRDLAMNKSKLQKLNEAHEALKFILGVKLGLQDYKEESIIDHEVVQKKIERYLTDEVEK